MVRVILHVDIDAFYASVEVREDPGLRGRPVIVGADPKGGRGVVMACSYEARRFGVRSGQPISVAYRRCPQGVYLRPRFELYERVSERVMRILKGFADRFEETSIDEAYLDVSGRVEEYGGVEALARRIKEEVARREGLTCSIGAAPSKVVAKIASERQKPDGLTIVEPHEVKGFLAPLPVSSIPGVGPKTEAALRERGVERIGQLAERPLGELVEAFGKNGVWLWRVANGVDESEVEEGWEPKSLSAEKTFERDVKDRVVVKALEELVEEVHRRLMAEGYLFRRVGIKIRFEDFETHTRERSLSRCTDSREVMVKYCRRLLREFDPDPRRIRLIGVRLSGLRRRDHQKTLLTWAQEARRYSVDSAGGSRLEGGLSKRR